MAREQFWSDVLGERVLTLCKKHEADPAEYESIVNSWLQEIDVQSRPTTASVIMFAKRKIYNLVPHN